MVQPELRHGDRRILRHKVVGILNFSVTLWIGEFPITMVTDAVKLEDPVIFPSRVMAALITEAKTNEIRTFGLGVLS